MTWTKGPWVVEQSLVRPASERCRPIIGGCSTIGFINDWEDDQRTAEANARLIAKAPEMAELLDRLRVYFLNITLHKHSRDYTVENSLQESVFKLLASIEGKDG